jgi:hypothetical protein
MTVVEDDLAVQIHADLSRIRGELTQARHRQRQRDSGPNRAAVAACRDRMDVVLDLLLEVRRAELTSVPPGDT